MEGVPGWVLYGAGWLAGWLLLWRTRTLPVTGASRPAVAVVVPARDEARALPLVLAPLVGQLRADDELVVVDDHSTDPTASVAAAHGATVVPAPPLPAGWIGKPHACWHGARATHAPVLVFIDADVRPGPRLIDGLAAALERHPGAVVSVQPWHNVERPIERASVLCNVVALMGSAAFTVLGRRVRAGVAFGPVLAVQRTAYLAAGGHAHASVRGSRTEDIGLARSLGAAQLFTGAAATTTFRMYPEGLRQLIAGWSRTMADGVAATGVWVAIAIVAWVWSLAGGVVAGALAGWGPLLVVYATSALQVWVLGRRAGRFGPGTAACYPLAVVVLMVVVGRGVIGRIAHRPTTWKGRRIQ